MLASEDALKIGNGGNGCMMVVFLIIAHRKKASTTQLLPKTSKTESASSPSNQKFLRKWVPQLLAANPSRKLFFPSLSAAPP